MGNATSLLHEYSFLCMVRACYKLDKLYLDVQLIIKTLGMSNNLLRIIELS